jgi:septal ring factor EnvC (AmiA/AmiB activator)
MEDRPVRAGDLRGLRRWLLVAVVWATAATAIAVIALLAANEAQDDNSEAGRQSARTAGQIGAAQRRLDRRVDEIESRLAELPSSDDVAGLETRLERVEQTGERTADRLEQITGSLDDLETRTESLEENPAASPDAGTETTP